MKENNIIFYANESADKLYIEKIENRLGIKCVFDLKDKNEDDVILILTSEGLFLEHDNLRMHGDYEKNIKRLKQGIISNELLVKCAKIKDKKENLVAIDATAGMGEDALLLAAYGFNVELYEQDKVICLLLEDTISRALKNEFLKEIVSRMHVHNEDSISVMKNLDYIPDVVLLDPMFPKRNKSALIKKKFQVIHVLENPCDNEDELLDAALSTKAHKIIIKRPLKADILGSIKQSFTIKGKAIRYDCIVR